MISYTCICMYMQHYMTKQSTYQSIKQLLVSKRMSSHSDTAATATVQRRHLALAFKVLPLMVKEKVSGRVLTTDAELNKNEKKIWQLMVFLYEKFAETTGKRKFGQVQLSNIDFLRVNWIRIFWGWDPNLMTWKENFFSS